MKIRISNDLIESEALKIVPVFDGSQQENHDVFIEKLISQKRFKTENGSIFHYMGETGECLLLGMGCDDSIDPIKVKSNFASAVVKMRSIKCFKAQIDLSTVPVNHLEFLAAAAEGLALKAYQFDKYKSGEKSVEDFEIIFTGVSQFQDGEEILEEVLRVVEGVNIARDLVNEPSNVIYPATLAESALKVGIESGFEVKVIDELGIEKLGMKAFQAVAQGSDQPPRLIVMRYKGNPEHPEDIIGYVGKGLTYDSGGYAIKPAEGMVTMKSDMGGAAAVIGAMSAIAKAKLKVNITGVIAACENMISGHAYRNGDIIGTMAGKTIEIINTDAEGRLTLIDAVTFAIEKEKVTKIVDVATLTGAVLVALGTTTTGVVTNNQGFYEDLSKAAGVAGERVWQLPSFDEYKKLYKSDIADFKNSGGRMAGTIGAGLFIGEFVKDLPWLHLDIAGSSWSDSESDLGIKGGTGAPVRTLYQLAKSF